MKAWQKGLEAGMDVLDAVKSRVNEILQSKEAKAFGRKLKSEAGKDKERLRMALKAKALVAINECEFKLKQAKQMLAEEECCCHECEAPKKTVKKSLKKRKK